LSSTALYAIFDCRRSGLEGKIGGLKIVFSLMMRGNLPPSSATEDDFCDFPLSDCFIMDVGEKAEFCIGILHFFTIFTKNWWFILFMREECQQKCERPL
jgi:hypothetical protein